LEPLSRQGQTRVAVILEISQPLQNGQELILAVCQIPLNSVLGSEVIAKCSGFRSVRSEKSVGSQIVQGPETLCLVLAQDVTDQQLASELAAKMPL